MKLPVHRATPVVRVTFWVPLLLLVLIMKQSHAVSDQFSELDVENFDLEIHIERLRELEKQNENFTGDCEVSVCVCLYIYIYIYIEQFP